MLKGSKKVYASQNGCEGVQTVLSGSKWVLKRIRGVKGLMGSQSHIECEGLQL